MTNQILFITEELNINCQTATFFKVCQKTVGRVSADVSNYDSLR